jgi:NAD(P)H-dependent flavin oxidoreductase YrpB (nitropropane dioxygenase family)
MTNTAGRRTRFTELVGCRWPVQLAGMGAGVGGPDLAAAVQSAGGLGMVSWGDDVPNGCGVNFLVPFIRSAADVTRSARTARVIEFFYGQPDPDLVATGHTVTTIVGWQVGSVGEAHHAVDAGCDYIVVQGIEAGGHVRGRSTLDELLSVTLDECHLPIVAAGGIATAERVAELIDRGADAVRVGTRFLTCTESCAHDDYVANLLAASADDTVLTTWFDGEWPDAAHRVLRASVDAAERSGWRSVVPPTRDAGRIITDMAQYAGMGVGAVVTRQPASAVVADLVRLL